MKLHSPFLTGWSHCFVWVASCMRQFGPLSGLAHVCRLPAHTLNCLYAKLLKPGDLLKRIEMGNSSSHQHVGNAYATLTWI